MLVVPNHLSFLFGRIGNFRGLSEAEGVAHAD